eukprot:5293191-Pleurochrysis_carterae.AAC.1
MVAIWSRGQTARQSASIATSLGYRDITECVRGFNARNVCRAQVGSDSPKWVIGMALQRSTLMEGYVGYPPRPDRMCPIGSYVLGSAGCHDNGYHVLYGAPRHIWM